MHRKLAEFRAEFDSRVSQDFHLAEDIELKKQLIDLFPVHHNISRGWLLSSDINKSSRTVKKYVKLYYQVLKPNSVVADSRHREKAFKVEKKL